LRTTDGFPPKKVMIDNSDAEIGAINMAYNLTTGFSNENQNIVFNCNVKILICHWHLLKAWKRVILTKVTAVNPPWKDHAGEEAEER
jgi:hypothetical protein